MHVLGILEFPAANAMAAESLGVTSLQSALCSILDLALQGAAAEANHDCLMEDAASGGRPRQGWQPVRALFKPMLKKMGVSESGRT